VLFCDSLPELREPEVRHFFRRSTPTADPDARGQFASEDRARRREDEGLISVVFLPTPRGLVIAQKREGRK
jgi:hypothetical protein